VSGHGPIRASLNTGVQTQIGSCRRAPALRALTFRKPEPASGSHFVQFFELQPWDAFEVTVVVGHNRRPVDSAWAAIQKIVVGHHFTAPCAVGLDGTEPFRNRRSNASPGGVQTPLAPVPVQGRELNLPEPQPWPTPVNGAKLFDELSATIRRYKVMTRRCIRSRCGCSVLTCLTPLRPARGLALPASACATAQAGDFKEPRPVR
jgi:hypothetical protein